MDEPTIKELRQHLIQEHNGYAETHDLDQLHWTHSMEHLAQEGVAHD